MKRQKGFTLVEIMIVVAIIVLLAAIAIPNLLRARISANEAAAASAVHTIIAAQIQYRSANPAYAALLTDLDADTPPYIDTALANGVRQGYNYASVGTANDFFVTAEADDNAQAHTFYADEDGIVCRSDALSVIAEVAHLAVAGDCPAGYTALE